MDATAQPVHLSGHQRLRLAAVEQVAGREDSVTSDVLGKAGRGLYGLD
jgi:hypothetical protein